MTRKFTAATVAAALGLVLGGCSATIPTDPDGTLDSLRGGVVRAGVSVSPPWTDAEAGEPSGLEVDLVEDFAGTLDAQVGWTVAGEEELVAAMERGELDVLVGGLTATSPWADKVALTYPYLTTTGPEGEKELHVMAVPSGENALMTELERFLLDQEVQQP
ncbi:transporter substrate-binding domain-containing protein [Cellulomonas sp. NS3]|uniref:transporter substrate-binding domain-containing protein n=1 Tax=Cellulomonas sp. NS3 TaxID=2973977 RepID=UPI0021630888|nr:transporter substrate-binding domain-containing protein [Cellulomonas sp. NS3]